ncbi:MAG TPA: hypothetical protein VGN13_12530 [Solirubrobacteraceae bacterium]|jgi:hypothetical protein
MRKNELLAQGERLAEAKDLILKAKQALNPLGGAIGPLHRALVEIGNSERVVRDHLGSVVLREHLERTTAVPSPPR